MYIVVTTLLLGAFPYQSLYCRVMKRKIDEQMRRCCLQHHQNPPRSINPSNALRTFKKPTLSVFEHPHSADPVVPAAVSAIHLPAPGLTAHSCLPQRCESTDSPPDLVIRHLDLRI